MKLVIDRLKTIAMDAMKDARKRLIVISSVLLFLVLFMLIILLVRAGSARKKTIKEPLPKLMTLKNNLIVPQSPAYPNDYIILREKDKKWTDAEIEKWFTVPGSKELGELERANDKIAGEILNAAP